VDVKFARLKAILTDQNIVMIVIDASENLITIASGLEDV
jgi:hypothetical protein